MTEGRRCRARFPVHWAAAEAPRQPPCCSRRLFSWAIGHDSSVLQSLIRNPLPVWIRVRTFVVTHQYLSHPASSFSLACASRRAPSVYDKVRPEDIRSVPLVKDDTSALSSHRQVHGVVLERRVGMHEHRCHGGCGRREPGLTSGQCMDLGF